MLILSRRAAESILIGTDIKVTVLRVKSGEVKIGITAPDHVAIVREEIAHIPHPNRRTAESVAEHLADADPDPDSDDDPNACVHDATKRCECWVMLANGKECPHAG